MNAYEWIQYYEKHRQRHAVETYDWSAEPPDAARPDIKALAGSLAIFQLGESGGGTRLRRYADALTAADLTFAGYSRAVEMFIKEENAHAELLKQIAAENRAAGPAGKLGPMIQRAAAAIF